MAADPHYRAFGYTHVQYALHDRLGLLFALVSLTPVFAMVSYATLVVSRRDLATISLTLGQLLNEVVNYALKRLIRQPRPNSPFLDMGTQPKWGMPSDHSQFVGFAAGYLTLWVARRWGVAARWRAASLLGLYSLASAVLYSRHYLGYHTLEQVAVGGAVGLLLGACWFAFTEAVLRPAFPRIEAWRASRWLLMRDCTLVPNVLRAEYEATCGGSGSGGGRSDDGAAVVADADQSRRPARPHGGEAAAARYGSHSTEKESFDKGVAAYSRQRNRRGEA